MIEIEQWDNEYWGVLLSPGLPGEKWLMIGANWHSNRPPHYTGEPGRPLTFRTRAQARAWVASKKGYYTWRFKVVRVRQTVEVME